MGVAILKSLYGCGNFKEFINVQGNSEKRSASTMCSVPVTANTISTYCYVIYNCKKTDGICVAWHLYPQTSVSDQISFFCPNTFPGPHNLYSSWSSVAYDCQTLSYPSNFMPHDCIAAAAAKSLQSCPTLCGPTDGSPPGSPVPGVLQARTLEWVAVSFSCINYAPFFSQSTLLLAHLILSEISYITVYPSLSTLSSIFKCPGF